MAEKHLGEVFDIHGGGIDLVFPHHENEIAQSRCAHDTPLMARFWLHNGFLQVEGEKMSKSLGNFITIHELLKRRMGNVIRYQMLKTHYRQPIDWTEHNSNLSQLELTKFGRALSRWEAKSDYLDARFLAALYDDLNTPGALSVFHLLCDEIANSRDADLDQQNRLDALHNGLSLLGFGPVAAFEERLVDFNKTRAGVEEGQVADLISARSAARKTKNFKEADRIRDELAAMGIALKDSKDPKTGEITTTWEVAR
jgi:cysteinyl-tRNA synthetase